MSMDWPALQKIEMMAYRGPAAKKAPRKSVEYKVTFPFKCFEFPLSYKQ